MRRCFNLLSCMLLMLLSLLLFLIDVLLRSIHCFVCLRVFFFAWCLFCVFWVWLNLVWFWWFLLLLLVFGVTFIWFATGWFVWNLLFINCGIWTNFCLFLYLLLLLFGCYWFNCVLLNFDCFGVKWLFCLDLFFFWFCWL